MTNKEIISSLRGLIGKYNLTDEEWQTVEKSIEVLSDSDGNAISRNNAITSICQWGTTLEKVGKCQITVAEMKQTCADMLNELPSIQPKKVGHWIEEKPEVYKCSNCGRYALEWGGKLKMSRYCPNCGAKMEENTLAIPNDTDLIRRSDAIEAVAASDFTDGSTAIFCGKYIIELLKGIPGVQS